MCCCCSLAFSCVVAPKGAVCVFASALRVYQRILLSKSSFKRLIFALLEQLTTNLQGISIPPHSCLQWRLRPVTSTHIFPPCAIKHHKVCEYSRGKWPTISLFLTTFRANLSASLPSSWSVWSFLPIVGFHLWMRLIHGRLRYQGSSYGNNQLLN